MAIDDISTPLGADLSPARKKPMRLPVGALIAGIAGLSLCGGLSFALMTADPLGGEPYGVAAIEIAPKATEPAMAAAQPMQLPLDPAQQMAALPEQGGQSSAAELEAESGIVVHRGPGQPPTAKVIEVPDPDNTKPGPVERNLSESSRHGLLPRVSGDGRRPLDIYARPVDAAKIEGKPRIAIILGGLGIGQSVTTRAIRSLPGEVSLAFAPYGGDLSRQVSRARDDGHEVFLHAPMEPFDYPDNDPGPQTLVTGQKPGATLDRLHWLMSRFQGYVGVINFMGARFMASESDFQVVAKEFAKRGVAFIQDGSVKDDGVTALVRANGGASIAADVVIDALADKASIDEQLAKLEEIARKKGVAIGVAAALPISVERLEIWAQSLKDKGIALVPASSLVR
jgi:uncharacterized protein